MPCRLILPPDVGLIVGNVVVIQQAGIILLVCGEPGVEGPVSVPGFIEIRPVPGREIVEILVVADKTLKLLINRPVTDTLNKYILRRFPVPVRMFNSARFVVVDRAGSLRDYHK